MRAGRSAEAERRDALRRRLYAPGVTEDDVAAYRSTRRSTAVRTRAVVAAATVLVAAATVAVVLTTHPPTATTSSRVSPTPARPAAVAESLIPTSTTMRFTFVGLLQQGQPADLLRYFSRNPTYLPANLRTNGRADSTEYSGRGARTIALDPSALAQHGGRVTVIVVTDRDASFSYAAERIAQRNDRSGPVVTLASVPGSTTSGAPVSSTFVYDGSAPTQLALSLDDAVRWDAVVVFTD